MHLPPVQATLSARAPAHTFKLASRCRRRGAILLILRQRFVPRCLEAMLLQACSRGLRAAGPMGRQPANRLAVLISSSWRLASPSRLVSSAATASNVAKSAFVEARAAVAAAVPALAAKLPPAPSLSSNLHFVHPSRHGLARWVFEAPGEDAVCDYERLGVRPPFFVGLVGTGECRLTDLGLPRLTM